MQVKWLLKYLDSSYSSWKKILDCWFARTSLGRAAILSSIKAKDLTRSMRGNIALPSFWRQALDALKELTLTRTQLSRDGVLSQPIWDNRHLDPPPIPRAYRDRWESLQVTVVHNIFLDRKGETRHSRKTNSLYMWTTKKLSLHKKDLLYIDTELDHHYFQ